MRETSAARCCWCQSALERVPPGPWLCPTPDCNARQREWGLITRETVGRDTHTRVLFMPVPRQVEFFELARTLGMQAQADPLLGSARVLFGGAAGPGKSFALRWGLYRDCLRLPNLNCLLLRRTFAELEETHLREMAREAEAIGAVFVRGEREMRFPATGSVIKAGHCESTDDYLRYLSTEYDRICFDELVTFMRDQSLEIMSRARTSKPAVMASGGAQVWGGTNPGGRGAIWVKQFFVDREVDPEEFPKYSPKRYGYVEARLEDNPYIDPAYRQTLEELPATRRRQLLEGDWEAFDGQFFDWQATRGGEPWHVAPLEITA